MNLKILKFVVIVYAFIYTSNLSAQDNGISGELKWRNIGPANMMGRIAAIDASNTDYRKVLIASASGCKRVRVHLLTLTSFFQLDHQ